MSLYNRKSFLKYFGKSRCKGWHCILFAFAVSVLFLIACNPESKKAESENKQESYKGTISAIPQKPKSVPKKPYVDAKPVTPLDETSLSGEPSLSDETSLSGEPSLSDETSSLDESSPSHVVIAKVPVINEVPIPDEPVLKKPPSIALKIPTRSQTTKAYSGSKTAFTYQEIIELVLPENPGVLNITSITRMPGQPNILTPNPVTKTLTFTNIDALTRGGQQGTYTVNFASITTHILNPPSLDIVFTVKKGYMNLEDIEIIHKLPEDFNESARSLNGILFNFVGIFRKEDVIDKIREKLPHESSNFNANIDTYGKLNIIYVNRANLLVAYKKEDGKTPFGKSTIPFSFHAPGIIKGYVKIIFNIEKE